MIGIGEMILGALSSERPAEDGESGPGHNPLWFLEEEYPNLPKLVRGRRVLDFGCGFGHQAAALASQRYGATVTGLDVFAAPYRDTWSGYPQVRFVERVPENEQFDVVISQNSMEHFPDPSAALMQMRSLLAPGGCLLLTFGPPWWAPYGSHMQYFCRLPWLQLWFSERTIMAVRARYRSDGATRFMDCSGGLNQMSVRKFERLIRETGFKAVMLKYHGVKRQQWLTRIPLVRELFTGQITAILCCDAETAKERLRFGSW